MTDSLQVEDGNYTRIVNPLIEKLIQVPFKGCELAVAMFIIRKTYGYQKTKDEISLTQFQQGTKRSRQTIVTAIQNLEKLNIVVKTGRPYQSNTYRINKYFDTWELVKTGRLVKRTCGLVKTGRPEVVKTGRHTKEKRNITKEISPGGEKKVKHNPLGAEILKAFETVDPRNKKLYGNTTERKACDYLLEEYGLERVVSAIKLLPEINQQNLYISQITTPNELMKNWVKLGNAYRKKKNVQDEKLSKVLW